MKKPIYFGEGIAKYLKYFAAPNIKKETQPLTSNVLIMGSKQYEMYQILIKKEKRLINPDLADLKIDAVYNNTYLYPYWNYLKYPQVNLTPKYCKTFTNEKFEEVGEDEYEDPILIFIGRERDL